MKKIEIRKTDIWVLIKMTVSILFITGLLYITISGAIKII